MLQPASRRAIALAAPPAFDTSRRTELQTLRALARARRSASLQAFCRSLKDGQGDGTDFRPAGRTAFRPADRVVLAGSRA